MKFLIINGPNMNMLGLRDAAHYGTMTIEQLNGYIQDYCAKCGDSVDFFQSNCEGEIIDALHSAQADAILLNPAAYTHYSYAIRTPLGKKFPCRISPFGYISKEGFGKICFIRSLKVYR